MNDVCKVLLIVRYRYLNLQYETYVYFAFLQIKSLQKLKDLMVSLMADDFYVPFDVSVLNTLAL